MAKLIVEILIPGNGKTYDFSVEENDVVGSFMKEASEQIIAFEGDTLAFDTKQPLLCSRSQKLPLNPQHTLKEAGVMTGQLLILL